MEVQKFGASFSSTMYASYKHPLCLLLANQNQVLLVLMKVELYFLSAFVISYGFIDVHYEVPEFQLTIAVIPAVMLQIFLTVYFTKREIIWGAIAAVVSQILVLLIQIHNPIPADMLCVRYYD